MKNDNNTEKEKEIIAKCIKDKVKEINTLITKANQMNLLIEVDISSDMQSGKVELINVTIFQKTVL